MVYVIKNSRMNLPTSVSCSLCSKPVDTLLRCSRCRTVFYCSKHHQEEDWQSHKILCNKVDEPSTSHNSQVTAGTTSDPDLSQLNQAMGTVTLNPTGVPFIHCRAAPSSQAEEGPKRNSVQWLSQMCQFVIRDLEKYGICVVDNFLGSEKAEAIHRSVVDLYRSGVFVQGETVTPGEEGNVRKEVRSDKITWVVGTEDKCQDIATLISTVGAIIMNAAAMKGNGELGRRNIDGRSRAMVSCYPANGTHYVKHVDNPNRDGRAVTTTYYLNKSWDCKEDGGLLRIFPQGWANQVVDIEPIMDRLVFFWSDRRNPHEVQPAFRTRYAITIWYFDRKERDEALSRKKTEECAGQEKVT